ncbi:MAG: D-tyrosyl-tRNA(Tyr) deacylase [Flavobacteriales bacterium]|nr:D-tyrosyl-tRNA(Tyr) deacylase [Flavobacteriales bacterium]
MRAVIQRVNHCRLEVEAKVVSEIESGLLILLGIEEVDEKADADWLAAKIANLRIFADQNGVMNESAIDQNKEMMVVSQFTLHASTKKGNRPSYIRAARPEKAEPLYQYFTQKMKETGCKTVNGIFGADMQIRFTNDGPVTIIIDSRNKE